MTSQEGQQIHNLRVIFIQVSTVYAIASDEESYICKQGTWCNRKGEEWRVTRRNG